MANDPSIVVSRNGKQFGPFTVTEVNSQIVKGELKSTDLGWDQHRHIWVPLSRFPGIIIAGPELKPGSPGSPIAPSIRIQLLHWDGGFWWILFSFLVWFTILEIARSTFVTWVAHVLENFGYGRFSPAQFAFLHTSAGDYFAPGVMLMLIPATAVLTLLGCLRSNSGRNLLWLTFMWLLWFMILYSGCMTPFVAFHFLYALEYQPHQSVADMMTTLHETAIFCQVFAFFLTTWWVSAGYLPGTHK
jgi:hypothetical protein